jgi:hypothetical protein
MRRAILFSAACVLATSGALSGSAIFGVCGTGFTDGTCATLAADGAADGNFTLTTGVEIAGPDAFVTSESGFPIGSGNWMADSALGKWIGPESPEVNDTPGAYTYQETFDLTGYNLASVVLTGAFGADNSATVALNGSGTLATSSGFTSLTGFTISTGFVAGLNTITFVVTNDAGGTGNPTGLMVNLSGTGTLNAVPEPASWVFVGLGFAAFGFLSFRRRLLA